MARGKKPFTFVLLGRPGCGKGTQAKFLAKHFGLKILGTGELLRHFAAWKNPLARKLKRELARGHLIPSWFVYFLWMYQLLRLPESKGIIFDGSPRKITEAEFLDEALAWLQRPRALALIIDISEKEARRRLRARRRSDDTPAAITQRFAAFAREVRPVIKRYRQRGSVLFIDGEQPSMAVFRTILQKLL